MSRYCGRCGNSLTNSTTDDECTSDACERQRLQDDLAAARADAEVARTAVERLNQESAKVEDLKLSISALGRKCADYKSARDYNATLVEQRDRLIAALREALRFLRDEQNGPPLVKRTASWRTAMALADAALDDTEKFAARHDAQVRDEARRAALLEAREAYRQWLAGDRLSNLLSEIRELVTTPSMPAKGLFEAFKDHPSTVLVTATPPAKAEPAKCETCGGRMAVPRVCDDCGGLGEVKR